MTTEIPVTEWAEFFKSFSEDHDRATVGVEVMSPEVGAQVAARELRFMGISADQAHQPSTLFVSLETTHGDHVTHAVPAPTHIWLERSPAGAELALQIETKDRSKTLLRFQPAQKAESFEGVTIDRRR